METIKLESSSPGYCNQCNKPKRVGKLKLEGWDHLVNMCPACIRDIANRIENKVNTSGSIPLSSEEKV